MQDQAIAGGTPAVAERAGVPLVAFVMFFVLTASYSINAMDRLLFPLLATDVRREYGFSLAEVGLLATIFNLGMAVAGLPTGYLLARLSRKAVLLTGIAIYSAGTALTVLSTGFSDMLVYRVSTGFGEAMQLTVLLAIAANYFTRYRAVAFGAVNVFFGVGAIIGPRLGGALIAAYASWRVPMLVFGLLGFAAMAVIALAVRPWFSEARGAAQERRQNTTGAPTLVNRNTVLLSLMCVLGGLLIYGFLGMYPTFLREGLGYAPATTGFVMSIFGIAVLASPISGWLGDRFSPRLVLGMTYLCAAVVGYLLFHGVGVFWFQTLLTFLWGLIASAIYVNIAGYLVKAVRGDLAGRASGVFVTTHYGAGIAAGYLMGWLAGHAGWGMAGEIQFTLLGVLGAGLALALQPDRISSLDAP